MSIRTTGKEKVSRRQGPRCQGNSDLIDRIRRRVLLVDEHRPGDNTGVMTDIATQHGFTRETLAVIASRHGGTGDGANRSRAFGEFEALPMPSPETEQWRYTDLRDFDLSFEPYAPRPWADNLDQVDLGLLEAAGEIGDRAGLALQHNSSTVLARTDPDVDRMGVHFESIDDALRDHPELLEGKLHGTIPTARTRFTALHGAFRTGGTFVQVPANVKVELPLQTVTYVDHDGLAVFPHTLIVLEEGAELTFIDRYVSPDLKGVFSDAVVEIHAGAGSRIRLQIHSSHN